MIGARLLDRYELVAELGRGGMGVVYRARDPLLQRDVAVKMLYGGPATGAHEQRFEREARLVAQLDHPAIVPIFDFGRHGDALFFVMPVVEGVTLDRLIRRRALRLGDALEIVAQVADALDHSHARGVLHRDVKPENVMVLGGGGEGEPRARIMDFGLAVGGDAARLTHTGSLAGTLAYLSPEQILSQTLDGRSDLYSLGTILYECLAGGPPFSGTRFSLLYRIAHEPPPALGDRAPDPALEGLILGCLAKEPGARPQRGRELATALRRVAARLGEEELGRPLGEPGGEGREPSQTRPRLAAGLPMLGREEELAALQRRLEAALAGACQLVLVAGETGMGKSRLLRELERLARARGLRVSRGRLADDRGAFPYQGFCEAVQDSLRSRAGDLASGALDFRDLAPDLLALYPVLAEVEALRTAAASGEELARPTSAAEPAPDRRRLFEVLARTVSRLAGGEPQVVLFEALHRADVSIEALQYVVRRLAPTPILFVATYRPSAAGRDHPLRPLLRAFRDDPTYLHLELGPLAREDHDRLVGRLLPGSSEVRSDPTGEGRLPSGWPPAAGGSPARLDAAFAAALFEATEGNPFFAQELVRSLLAAGGVVRGDDGAWALGGAGLPAEAGLPEGVRQVVEARLEHLPEPLRDVLAAAAVLGRHFDFQDLRALADPDGLDDRVDRLLRDGLLEEDARSRGDLLRFASGLVRDVLYARLPRRRRRRLHRAAAVHLESRHHDRLAAVGARLVRHWAAADDPGKTVEHARVVARAALAAGDAEGARRALGLALDFVDEGSPAVPPVVEAELRRLLAEAHRLAGDATAALGELAAATRLAEGGGDLAAAAEAASSAAQTAWRARRVEEARDWVDRGLRLAAATADGAPAPASRLLALGATLANLRGDLARARAYLAEAAQREGPGERPGAAPALAAGGTLVTVLANPVAVRPGASGDGPPLDPAAFEAVDDMEVLACVFEPLLRTGDDGGLEPWLAAEWESRDGGRTFEVALRAGVRFADGAPVDAPAVAASFARAAAVARRPVPALAAIAGVEVEDARRLRFRLAAPLPVFPALLTDLAVAVTREADGGLVGSGPFVLESVADGRLVLARNGGWWRTPPRLSRLVFRCDLDVAGVADALRAEELDLARELRAEDLAELLRRPRFRRGLVEAVRRDVYFVLWNAGGPVACSSEVRRALSGAIRVRDLVWRTVGRFAEPASGWLPPGILGHDPGRRRRELPRERVEELLRRVGGPLRLRAAVHPVLADRYAELTAGLFAEWAALGVEVERVEAADGEPPMDAFLRRLADPSGIDLCVSRWLPEYEDPDNFTHLLFHSQSGQFRRHLPDAAADPLLERARQEERSEVRERLYRQAERHLLDAGVVLPLFHDIDYRLAGPRVRELALQAAPPWVAYGRVGVVEASPAPAPAEEATGAEARRSTVRTAVATPLASLDPALAIRLESAEIVPNVFETLTVVDEGARVVPFLAESFASEEGGRRWRFRLRESVRFHDGRRLGARDVRASFERLLRTPHAGAESALLAVKGAAAFRRGEVDELEGLAVRSAREVAIELDEPLPLFAARLSHPTTAISPEGSVDFGGGWRHGCAGSGPFRVVRLDTDHRLELEANPHYWRPGLPRAERLVFELAVPLEQLAPGLRSGRLGLVTGLSARGLDELARDPAFATGIAEAPGFSTYYLLLAARRGPLADPIRRRAVAAALAGLAPLLRRTVGRSGIPAHGILPPGLLGYDPAAQPPPESVASVAGTRLRVGVHPAYRERYPELLEGLVARLEAAGIAVEESWAAEPEAELTLGADLVATRWFAEYPDPDSFAGLFHSAGLDGHLIGDPATDRRIEQARRETEPSLRDALYREIDATLVRDGRVVPLFHEQVVRVARPELRGLRLRFRCPEVAYEELSVAG